MTGDSGIDCALVDSANVALPLAVWSNAADIRMLFSYFFFFFQKKGIDILCKLSL